MSQESIAIKSFIGSPGVHVPLEVVVLTADLVGYSELVFRDVQNSISVLRATRAILATCIHDNGGQVLHTPGDFVLATFSDFDQALQAAIGAQAALFIHHSSERPNKGGHWKIGIAAGDVYVVEGEYFGNAINVAARLQSLARAGDILFTTPAQGHSPISGAVLEDLGIKWLKNIDQPIHVHRVYLPQYSVLLEETRQEFRTPPRLMKHLRKPVLRLQMFRDLNAAENNLLLIEGLVGEVQLILSRLSNSISVIDPAAAKSGKPDYILSGSVQSGGPFMRISVRLTSCADGLTLWAERYECDLNQSFEVQDHISREIVSALQLRLTDGEQAQLVKFGTKSGKAWDYFQRAHDVERQFTREGHERAIALYLQALELDPDYLSALVALAFCHLDQVRLGWSADDVNSIAEAERLSERASRTAGEHADVSALAAFLCYFQGRWDAARAEMRKAVQLAPHSPQVLGYQGALFGLIGDYRAEVGSYLRALSLSAHAPAWIPANLGLSYLALGNNEEAEHIYREVLEHYPKYVRAWIGLGIALNRQGKEKDARNAAEHVLLLDPSFSSAEWAKSRPFIDDTMLNAFVADLRAIGLV